MSHVSPLPEKTLFIDISKPALSLLKQKGYKTLHGSVTKIPLNDNSLDIIFCSEVLEHVSDYKKALNEFQRVLKNSGLLFITVPCWQKYWNIDDEFVGHFRRFNPLVFQREIESSGLILISKKNIGSKLERSLTLQTVKNFKKNRKIPDSVIIPYILANQFLSILTSLTAFLTTEKNSSIILFICKKI
jgi:ubiquinone/menaquinone biosynthesis C-methylase UbiE